MTCTLVGFALLVLGSVMSLAGGPPGSGAGGAPPSDTVYVAPPTGREAADRANIVAALERVGPGGTVQFAPGIYAVGTLIAVTTPGVTLLGEGTVLRGCDLPALREPGRRPPRDAVGSFERG
jgi:hypothetical protein